MHTSKFHSVYINRKKEQLLTVGYLTQNSILFILIELIRDGDKTPDITQNSILFILIESMLLDAFLSQLSQNSILFILIVSRSAQLQKIKKPQNSILFILIENSRLLHGRRLSTQNSILFILIVFLRPTGYRDRPSSKFHSVYINSILMINLGHLPNLLKIPFCLY